MAAIWRLLSHLSGQTTLIVDPKRLTYPPSSRYAVFTCLTLWWGENRGQNAVKQENGYPGH